MLSHRTEQTGAGADGGVAPAGVANRLAQKSVIDNGVFGSALPGFQRWPSVAATLAPWRLAGPLLLSGRAGATRDAPLHGVTSDGGADGVGPADRGWSRTQADPTELDGKWQPGERLAVSRLDARAELAAPVQLGWLSVMPWVRGAVLGYAFDANESARANGWWVGGLQLSTLLSRRYGTLRHVLEPRVEWLLASPVMGRALPAFGYDAWDRADATPPGTSARLRGAALRLRGAARPLQPAPAGGRLLAPFPGLRAAARRGGAGGRPGPRQAGGGLRQRRGLPRLRHRRGRHPVLDRGAPGCRRRSRSPTSWLDRFSELRLQLSAGDGRGDDLHGGLLAFGPGGSGRIGAGVDALFDTRPI